MNIQDACSQLVMGGLRGTCIDRDERDILKHYPFSGITVFARNITADPFELTQFTESFQNTCLPSEEGLPKLIAIDQEGGRVRRLRDSRVPDIGPPLRLAKNSAYSLGEKESMFMRYGQELGDVLLKLGCNINFAPVVDILTEESNTSIGDRCFGTEVESQIPLVSAFIEGSHKAGVATCLKHFPGQGDAKVDAHFHETIIDASWQTLSTRELAAFTPHFDSCPMVMLSHAIYPAVDSLPASLSKTWILDILRVKLGYEGLAVSDDMLMAAVHTEDVQVWQNKIVESVASGADIVLVCEHLEKSKLAVDGLVSAAKKSLYLRNRIEESCERVLKFRSERRS